jgi:diaminopropionate ammonia-lyase
MSFEIIQHQREEKNKPSVEHLNLEVAGKVNRFHKSFPMYEPTPIRELSNLASKLWTKRL